MTEHGQRLRQPGGLRRIGTIRAGLLCCAAVVGLAAAGAAEGAPAKKEGTDAAGVTFFEKNIRPVLAKHCYECHSAEAEELEAGLRLDTREGIREGGSSGLAAVVPGEPDESLLLTAIRYRNPDLQMPPEHRLQADVVAEFEKWIAMGAPDPRDGEAPKLTNDKTDLWSLQPVVKPAVPEVEDQGWPRNAIDRFLLHRMEREGLRPVGDAGKTALVRRLYFDLTGLPPSPEQIDRFVNDDSPDAYEKLVDRLLDSPRFGERWGRHWLDVARYAESSGKTYNFAYPYAWRYRDYVIDSFNEDKPYDEFVKEQIAGDLMDADGEAERVERIVATGFLALGVKDHNARNKRRFNMDVIDEQIDVMSRSMLGMSVACARCHDHKFDPISIEEYYALAGVFDSTRTLFGTSDAKGKGGNPNQMPGELQPIGPNAEKLHEKVVAHDKKAGKISKQSRRARRDVQNLTDKIKAAKSEAKKKELRKKREEAKERRKKLEQQLKEMRKNPPERPDYAMAVRDKEEPGNIKLHKGGSIRRRGKEVPRGFPEALTLGKSPEIEPKSSGRLALAEWIGSERNPLTARVMVNRIWQHLFGRGLVSTPGNFGRTGAEPSHPALLDYLAARFVERGWSVKRAVRSIVMSRAYRLSTRERASNAAADPENVYLWRMNRKPLEAEAIRDAMLAASGRLDLTRPPHGSVLHKLGPGVIGRNHRVNQILTGSNRRSVYLPIMRDEVPKMLRLFGFANPTMVVADREEMTVPEQALFMMNSDFVREQAENMAARLLKRQALDEPGRVTLAYRLALGRAPSDAELSRARDYLSRMGNRLTDNEGNDAKAQRKAWATLCQALFASADFRYLLGGSDEPRQVATKR